MRTLTPVADPVSPRFDNVPDPTLGPDEPLAYQASGPKTPRAATRRTDERGRPLSIFKARRRG